MISCVDGVYRFNLYTRKHQGHSIEIKIVDQINNVQIWKNSQINQNGDIVDSYQLRIPLSNSMKLPVLGVINSATDDDTFEDFDKIDLKGMFER